MPAIGQPHGSSRVPESECFRRSGTTSVGAPEGIRTPNLLIRRDPGFGQVVASGADTSVTCDNVQPLRVESSRWSSRCRRVRRGSYRSPTHPSPPICDGRDGQRSQRTRSPAPRNRRGNRQLALATFPLHGSADELLREGGGRRGRAVDASPREVPRLAARPTPEPAPGFEGAAHRPGRAWGAPLRPAQKEGTTRLGR